MLEGRSWVQFQFVLEQPYLVNSLGVPLCTLLVLSSQVLLHTSLFCQNLWSEDDGKTIAQVSELRLQLEERQLEGKKKKKKDSLYLQATHSCHQVPERQAQNTSAVSFREKLCFYKLLPELCSLIRHSSSKDERALTEDNTKNSALWSSYCFLPPHLLVRTGAQTALCWSWHLGLAEAGGSHWGTQTLHCPRSRQDLVPLPKGRSKPALARAAHICCWTRPECCKDGSKPREPEPPLSHLWKGKRHHYRNGQVWRCCPSQVSAERLRLLWQHSFYLWITVIWKHCFSTSWNSGPNANM